MVTLILLKIRLGPNGLVVKEDLFADKEQGQDGEDVLGEALLATSRASDQFSEPAIVIAGIFWFLVRLIRPLPQM